MANISRENTMSAQRSAGNLEALQRARAELMGGRGPGADDAEVAAHTRDRVVVAGMSSTRRLELGARDTIRARGVESELADLSQRAHAEHAHPEQRLGRDHPVDLAGRAEFGSGLPRAARTGWGGRRDRRILLGGAALLIGWGLRRLSGSHRW